ncbi:winged helix-turn-helix domain-containing protein [Ornithinimicrobium sp. Y1847]|uniref:winged helix-turn-helix domain-containing protein n=1 Tax=Ornithinimicrobium sp. Y1847 TaxID=3405419 RepID=UPI003B67C4CB
MSGHRTIARPLARRIALAAQGFGRPRPAEVGTRQLNAVMERLQVVQIDSVNVLTRSHYLPFFARLGPYDTALLDRLRDGAGQRGRSKAGRTIVEYWAHEAALIPFQTWPELGFRMTRPHAVQWRESLEQEHPGLLDAVTGVLSEQAPSTAREVEAHLPHGSDKPNDHWGWNWSAVKTALECLFRSGLVTSAGRTSQFERRYAVPSAVLPPEVMARAPGSADAPSELESATGLLRRAAQAHGIGTKRCLADYYRLGGPVVDQALADLVAAGELDEVRVPGWKDTAYLDPEARRPRSVSAAALLSPFDSLVWQRERIEALWDFRYRLEIYTPAAKRVHGYYVLPFLLDEALVGRVDLKADRGAGVLRVQSLHWEEGVDVAAAAPRLMGELEAMAGWLGLGRVDLPTGSR